MNKIAKLVYLTLYKLHLADSVKIAKKIGVSCGDGCRFLDNPFVTFGSEPYLIKIGNNVELTNGTRIVTHDGGLWVLRNHDYSFKNSDFFAPVRIGDNVFVGINSIIMPGVTIGNNVIVGAGSVVTKDIPDGTVACGVPARVVKTLEEYKERKKTSIINTKGLSFDEKRKALQKLCPEWFGEMK